MEPEDQLQAQTLQDLMDKLNGFVNDMRARGVPMKLHNTDGSVNYNAVMDFLYDPKYSKYRDAHPEIVRQARSNIRTVQAQAGGAAALNFGKLAFSLDQIRQSKQIDNTPPSYPRIPQRNQALQREISRTEAGAETGMTPLERRLAQEGVLQNYRKLKQDIVTTSGGQSGATQANLQVAAQQRGRSLQALEAQAYRQKAEQQQRLGGLIGQQMSEDANRSQFEQNRFRYQQMPMYEQRVGARERLLAHGLTNAFGAADKIYSDMNQLGQMFRGDLPGYVPPNEYYDNEHPLDAIYNNPLRRMRTDLPMQPSLEVPNYMEKISGIYTG